MAAGLALDRYPAMNEPQDHVSQSIDADWIYFSLKKDGPSFSDRREAEGSGWSNSHTERMSVWLSADELTGTHLQ